MLSKPNSNHSWLMIIYRVPSTPSTSRVTVWKRIKELGAFLLQQSVYVLPNLPRVRESLNQLRDQIQHLGGESKIIEIASLGEEQEKEVIAGFNRSREEEYTEVVKACDELLREIEQESRTEDFHFADLEENEKHLQRVSELLDSVRSRDYFDSPLQTKAAALIEVCQKKFEAFSHEVFSREGVVSEDKRFGTEPATRHRESLTTSRKELTSRIEQIVAGLAAGALEIDGAKAGNLPEAIGLKWELKEQRGEKSLSIEISWSSPRPARR